MSKPQKKFDIDFYQKFSLPYPVECGLVSKVISPKGKRQFREETQQYHYSLNEDLIQIYEGKPCQVTAGLYHVMDIYKRHGQMTWNHYLFIVGDDGKAYPIAEYIKQTDSSWIKVAIKTVKQYFDGDELERVILTRCYVDKKTQKIVKG